eukprot:GHVL01005486.1.p1 GENE.GHVL01005486.1~~GHVL01005486.1.p1  ORF type:complete len:904 (+),score=149.02 GHVL01005486.1:1363-4074(+)
MNHICVSPLPKWYQLESTSRGVDPESMVLLTLFKSDKAIPRHNRSDPTLHSFTLRAYLYRARRLLSPVKGEEPNAIVRIECAGVTAETKPLEAVTSGPEWYEMLELSNVRLLTDDAQHDPTPEPIIIEVLHQPHYFFGGGVLSGIAGSRPLLGRCHCTYNTVRRKERGISENFSSFLPKASWQKLHSQQIKESPTTRMNIITGGPSVKGSTEVGELMIAFELIRSKDLIDYSDMLQPSSIVPDITTPVNLSLTILGLRDMDISATSDPIIKVTTSTFAPARHQSIDDFSVEKQVKTLQQTVQWKDSNTNAKWATKIGKKELQNYQFFKALQRQILVPYDPAWSPELIVRVYSDNRSRQPIGETRISLAPLLPWITDPITALEAADSMANKTIENFKKDRQPNLEDFIASPYSCDMSMEPWMKLRMYDTYIRPSAYKRATGGKASSRRTTSFVSSYHSVNSKINDSYSDEFMNEDELVFANGLPAFLLSSYSAATRPPKSVHKSDLMLNADLDNWILVDEQGLPEITESMEPRIKLESNLENYLTDLYFRKKPLIRGGDPQDIHGYIKCLVMLSDDSSSSKIFDMPNNKIKGYDYRFEPASESADVECYEALELRHFYTDIETLPSRLRLRIYILSGMMIQCEACPFIKISVGSNTISFRNHPLKNDDPVNPDFSRIEELEIKLPECSRLEIAIWDKKLFGDEFIGSTVLDLEDRWFSQIWQSMKPKRQSQRSNEMPVEFCSLLSHQNQSYSPESDDAMMKGILQFWVEMFDFGEDDVPLSVLPSKPDLLLDIRIVIWSVHNVRLLQGGDKPFSDIKIICTVNSNTYEETAQYPATQETDVHRNSTDGKAQFNWRILYPKIPVRLTENCALRVKVVNHYDFVADTEIGEVKLKRLYITVLYFYL